MSSITATVSNR